MCTLLGMHQSDPINIELKIILLLSFPKHIWQYYGNNASSALSSDSIHDITQYIVITHNNNLDSPNPIWLSAETWPYSYLAGHPLWQTE